MKIYYITPVPAPRMTRADAWKKRPPVLRYFAFRDEVKLKKVELPDRSHVTFVLPMAESWSKKKKEQMMEHPHRQKPDVDNLFKALSDSVYGEDCALHDMRITKIWGDTGKIIIDSL